MSNCIRPSIFVLVIALAACSPGPGASPPRTPPGTSSIDLAQALAAGTLLAVNRTVATIHPTAVRLSAADGNGVAWVSGTNVATGTIEMDVRGRGPATLSYVGVAFHRKDDQTYEVVYVRPFNFRTSNAQSHHHAVQYIQLPDYDFDRLRRESPEQFENAVDPSLAAADWVHLRVVIDATMVRAYVGPVKDPTLDVRKLGQSYSGEVGLWVGNASAGDFANLVVRP